MSSSGEEIINEVVDAVSDAGDAAKETAEDAVNEGAEVIDTFAKASLLRLKAIILTPLLLGAASLTYYFTIDGIMADALISTSASIAGDDGHAEVGDVTFSIFGPSLEFNDLQAWQTVDGEDREVLYVGNAKLDVDFWALFEHRLDVKQATVTTARFAPPKSPPPEAEDGPTTDEEDLQGYLESAREILNSDDVQQLRDWLEKIREYQSESDDDASDEEEKEPRIDLPASPRADYVRRAFAILDQPPTVLVREAGIEKVDITFTNDEGSRYVKSITDLHLKAHNVSSDPAVWKKPMEFSAAGNIDGDANKRAEIDLTLRFDESELVTLEQIDGRVKLASLNISSILDRNIFGDTLSNATLSLERYDSSHPKYAGRAVLRVEGALTPPATGRMSMASIGLWFGGYNKTDAPFAPSGISVHVTDMPLSNIWKPDDSGLPIMDGATVTLGTCDSEGNFGSPDAALSWHDGLSVNLRLQVTNLRFREDDGELFGMPAPLVARGLNRVIAGLGGLDLVLGFRANKNEFSPELLRPGSRDFLDAVVNALALTSTDIRSIVDLPFAINDQATFSLSSVTPDGTARKPALTVQDAPSHDFGDLRVAINIHGLNVQPKPSESTILGLPSDEFCRAFNAFFDGLGPNGLNVRTRLFNADRAFSPALESPGVRGVVDAMINAFSYSAREINTKFDLPFVIESDTQFVMESVDSKGSKRTFESAGADEDSLSGLQVRVRGVNFTIKPKAGESTILGIPSDLFVRGFNSFVRGQGSKGLALGFRVFDGQATFAPSLTSPGTRGIVDGVINTLTMNGDEMNRLLNLPFTLVGTAKGTATSIDTNNDLRRFTGPDADSNDLSDLRLRVVLNQAFAAKKKGHDKILGVPAEYFTFAWNQLQASQGQTGYTVILRVFDKSGKFAPTVEYPNAQQLMLFLGNSVGVMLFEKNYKQLESKFKEQFPAFKKGGIKAAQDWAKGGKFKLPGTGDKDKPKDDKKKDNGKKIKPPKIKWPFK